MRVLVIVSVLFLSPLLTDAQNVVYVNSTKSNNTIRIGYLVTDFGPPYRGPAINLALQQGQADGLLAGYNFSIFFHVSANGSSCQVKDAVFGTMYMLDVLNIDILFGPYCSPMCTSLGYVASYRNIPFFPEYCGDTNLDDKNIYNTMIRIGGAWRGLGTAFVYILQTYGWRRLVVMTDTISSSMCNFGGTAITSQLSTVPNVTVSWIRMVDSPTQADVSGYLNQAKVLSRIIVYCHSSFVTMQQLLYTAQDFNMMNGDFVWFSFPVWVIPPITQMPWLFMPGGDMSYRIKAFYAVKQVTFMDLSGPNDTQFLNRVLAASSAEPWNMNATGMVNNFASYLYDSVYLYLKIADQMLKNGSTKADIINGSLVYRKSPGTRFRGITGSVQIDSNGDRLYTYSVWTYGPGQPQFAKFMEVNLTRRSTNLSTVVNMLGPATWGMLGSAVPPDTPACGFYYEYCPPPNNTPRIIIGCCIAGVVLLAAFFTALNVRSRRAEAKIQQMLWKIDNAELVYTIRAMSTFSKTSGSNIEMSVNTNPNDDKMTRSFHAINERAAQYRGSAVSVYHVSKMDITLTRRDLIALKNLKELNHVNIRTFVGACIDPGHLSYVFTLCSRGTVQDVIEDDNFKLDWLFRISLISDLINGMSYIHKSVFLSHGHLTSACCHIDSRWVLKIDGFGLDVFHETNESTQAGDHAYYREQLWTAPELLRMKRRPFNGTQKGDVYSFAIIIQEIAFRAQPYFCEITSPKHIIEKVSRDSPPFYRPTPQSGDPELPSALVTLMEKCWAEQPSERPSFDDVLRMFRQINKGKKIDIVDNMLQKLEKYAENLEELVQQRTSELEDEKTKTDMLLHRMLPKFIADELKAGRVVVPQLYPLVTIYFSDIVGFTTLSSQSTPFEVVELLNDLYGTFDDTIARHDVYKVETIGDAYMVVSGLPKPNEGRHICEICNMALDLLSEVDRFVIRHHPNEKLKLRIGIHTGPCAAGVVGHAMPRYCLFGDTVNVASRMESTGEALKIHLSDDAKHAISAFGNYTTEQRGETFVKGKGMLPTYWLLGKTNKAAIK